jgi:hypothetical protein
MASIPLNQFMEKYRWHILLFLLTFFLISALTLPKVFINDEWITVNQLAQMDNGHQLIYNEGKYGSFENGTPNNYFVAKDNRLGYTIFLPLISLPVLKIMHFFGDLFLYLFLILMSGILIVLSWFVHRFFTKKVWYGVYWSNFLIIAAFIIIIMNMVFFTAFPLNNPKVPFEVAAIGVTNLVLLSTLSVLLFDTYEMIFTDHQISVPATALTFCCSSYLFWATTAKDHLLVAFLVMLLIWCGVRFLYSEEICYLNPFFLTIGLIAWARAEIAVPLFTIFLVIVVGSGLFRLYIKHDKKALAVITSPLFTILGALPFFINNFLITKNPLVPAFTFYEDSIVSNSNILGSTLPVQVGSTSTQSSLHFIENTFANYIPPGGVSLSGLLKILFLPQAEAAAIFVVCPLLIAGLVFAILNNCRSKSFSRQEKQLFLFLSLISVCIFFAYIRSWEGMPVSLGMVPDVRYFSPLYIPFGIMGLILLQKSGLFPPVFSKEGVITLMFTAIEISVIIVIFMRIFRSPDMSSDRLLQIISTSTTCILYAILAISIIFYFLIHNPQKRTEYCTLLLCSVIIIPLVWQIGMIFLSSIIFGSEGYTYWMPFMKVIFQGVQNFLVSNF